MCKESINKDLKTAAERLRRGEVILYPTDTVWGLGCDASDENAVSEIYRLKHRADSKALIVLVADEEMLARYIGGSIPTAVKEFMAEHRGRAMTVVYPGGHDVAANLLAEDGSIGIRVVSDGFAHDLCNELGGALVSTSANISGEPSARTYSEIARSLKEGVGYVSESGRDNQPGTPSMVVKYTADGSIIILRD
ncbi:MAG: threonylcarbamoyl-AMP synthase [Duncaniella sp.]|nr:threonylcarbamoyl-AMP synthase [Duncaniella sp.]